MSDKIKVNEKGLEVKRPFRFANLGINNIGPNDVMDSNCAFTYIQGTINPSVVVPLDNVYDPVIKHNILFGDYLHYIDNLNEFEYININRHLAETLIKRAMSAISQNVIIIYENGLGKFIKPFIRDNTIHSANVLDGIGDYLVIWQDIFKARTEETVSDLSSFGNIEKSLTSSGDDVITNSLDAIGKIIDRVANNYNRIINYYIREDRLDLKAFTQYILTADDIDFVNVDESQYIGTVVGALNQVAVDDLNKIREIAEIELMQATSQYYRDYNKD